MAIELLPVDPALVETAAEARHRRGARSATPTLAAGDRPGQRAVPRRGRTGDQRRRVRPALPRARRARDRLPGADHRRVADAARRRRPDRRHVRRGPPRPADAVAVERVQPRRAARVRCPRAQGPRPAGGARARPRPALRRRAQDRWPRDQPPLRPRPVRPGRDPRRRHDRRGRDREPADDLGHPGPAHGARHARGARRGVHAQGRVQAHQRRSARRPGSRSTPTRATAAPARFARSIRRSRPAGSCRPGSTSWSRTATRSRPRRPPSIA